MPSRLLRVLNTVLAACSAGKTATAMVASTEIRNTAPLAMAKAAQGLAVIAS